MNKYFYFTIILIVGMFFISGCDNKGKKIQEENKKKAIEKAKKIKAEDKMLAEQRRIIEEQIKAEEKRIADWKRNDCPKSNQITKFTSTGSHFKSIQPLDFSKILSAKASANKAGTILQISMVVPKKGKIKWRVGAVVNFTNAGKPIVKGIYKASAGSKKPFLAKAEINISKGKKYNSIGFRNDIVRGTAEIIEMTNTNVCGKFNLYNKKGDTIIKGNFNMKIERMLFL